MRLIFENGNDVINEHSPAAAAAAAHSVAWEKRRRREPPAAALNSRISRRTALLS